MQPEFQEGLEKLKEEVVSNRVAICCSERHPARCHRLLISTWLALNGWTVCHILDGPKGDTLIEQHEPGKWGASPQRNTDGTITYPQTN